MKVCCSMFIHSPTNINKGSKRGFVQFVLEPIYSVFATIQSGDKEEIDKLLKKIDIKLPPKERDFTDKDLLKVIIMSFVV